MSDAPASERQSRPVWPPMPAWSRREVIFLLLCLIVAATLRVAALDHVPPGMQHDEVFDARFSTLIRSGATPVFFDENAGVPPLFMYIVSLAFRLLGQNVLALRLTAASIGVAGLLVSYLLLRQLFERLVAQIALAGLTVSFWHLFDSRVGLEPITIPLLAGLSFYALWRGLRRGALAWLALAGLFMGLAPYGYHSGPLIPATVGLFVVYLLLFRRPWLRGESGAVPLRRAILSLALMFLIAVLVVAPLAMHILGNSDASMLRVNTLSHHMTLLLAGQPGPIAGDIAGVLGMFFWRGDPEWRYNVAGRPVFDPLSGLLFLAGLALCLRRRRQPKVVFLLLWIPVNLLTAAITPPSPSSLRSLGAIAAIYALPAIALAGVWQWASRRAAPAYRVGLIVLAAGLWAGNLAWTVRDYFCVWPANPEVRAIYRADLAAAARYLDTARPTGTVLVSALFAADLDQQTFDYMLRHKRPTKWFDAQRAFPIPALHPDEPVTYLFPLTDPATPAILRRLESLQPTVESIADRAGRPAVMALRLTPEQMERLRDIRPRHRLDLNLGDEIDLLGYSLPDETRAGESIDLTVYWRVRRGGRGERSYAFFAHVLDRRGFGWAQDDPTGFPSHSWWPGDTVVQSFALHMPPDAPPAEYDLRIGVYEQGSGARLAVPGSADNALDLRPLKVATAASPPRIEQLQLGTASNANFAGRLTLLGYDIPDRILNLEERVEMALTWQAPTGGAPDVLLELTLTSERGQVLPPLRRRLVDGRYPLDQWAAGQIVRDRFWLEHSPDIPRSVYTVALAMLDAASGQPLTLAGGERVSLGKVFMRGLK